MFGKKRKDDHAITELFEEYLKNYRLAKDTLQAFSCQVALGQMLAVCQLASKLGYIDLSHDLSARANAAVNEKIGELAKVA